MPRSARVVRTRWPSCSRKPVSGSRCSVMPFFVSLPGQTNFAISPPIEIPCRFQPFGFDEGFDPVGDEIKFRIYAPWGPFRAIGQYIYACVESFRDVADDTENL